MVETAPLGHREGMTTDHMTRPSSGRVYGWISGLGFLGIPWFVAGVVSTFTSNPESAFPPLFGVAFAAMLGWSAYASFKVPGFRGAFARGFGVAAAATVLLVLLLRTSYTV